MLDLNQKVFDSKAMKRKLTALDAIENHSSSSSKRSSNGGMINEKKSCTNCGTNKTPLWRGGPAGPKSLCNACGIKNRKRRRTVMGSEDKKARKVGNARRTQKLSESLGREVMMQRSSTVENQRRRKLGEEEQAAILLMALSYASSVYS